jgi:hypothetical protein
MNSLNIYKGLKIAEYSLLMISAPAVVGLNPTGVTNKKHNPKKTKLA